MDVKVHKVLTRLNSLSTADRSWVLSRLSADSKATLLGYTKYGSAATKDSESTKANDVVSRFSPTAIASLVNDEPGWIISVIAQSDDENWNREFEQALPEHQRILLGSCRNQSTALSDRVVSSIKRIVCQRARQTDVSTYLSKQQVVVTQVSVIKKLFARVCP